MKMLRQPNATKFKLKLNPEALDPEVCIGCADRSDKRDFEAYLRRFPDLRRQKKPIQKKHWHTSNAPTFEVPYPSVEFAKTHFEQTGSSEKHRIDLGGTQPDMLELGRSMKKQGGYVFDYRSLQYGCKANSKFECLADTKSPGEIENIFFRNGSLVERKGQIRYCTQNELQDGAHWCSKIKAEHDSISGSGVSISLSAETDSNAVCTVTTASNLLDTLFLAHTVNSKTECMKDVSEISDIYLPAKIGPRDKKLTPHTTMDECLSELLKTGVSAVEFTDEQQCFATHKTAPNFFPSSTSKVVTRHMYDAFNSGEPFGKKRPTLPWEADTPCEPCGHILDSTSTCKLDLGRYLLDEFESSAVMHELMGKKQMACLPGANVEATIVDGRTAFRNSPVETVLQNLLPETGKTPMRNAYPSSIVSNEKTHLYEKKFTTKDNLAPYKSLRIKRGGYLHTKTQNAEKLGGPLESNLKNLYRMTSRFNQADFALMLQGMAHAGDTAPGFNFYGGLEGKVLANPVGQNTVEVVTQFLGNQNRIGLRSHGHAIDFRRPTKLLGYVYKNPTSFTTPLWVTHQGQYTPQKSECPSSHPHVLPVAQVKNNRKACTNRPNLQGRHSIDNNTIREANYLVGHMVAKGYQGLLTSKSHNFEFCARDGEECYIQSGRPVEASFGYGAKRTTKEASASFKCDTAFFGSDPAPGKKKACYIRHTDEANKVTNFSTLGSDEQRDLSCLINNPDFARAKWVPEKCTIAFPDEDNIDANPDRTKRCPKGWFFRDKSYSADNVDICISSDRGGTYEPGKGKNGPEHIYRGGNSFHKIDGKNVIRAAHRFANVSDWLNTCTAGVGAGEFGSCMVQGKIDGSFAGTLHNIVRQAQVKRLEADVERIARQNTQTKKFSTIESAATCEAQCDQDPDCAAFSVDSLGVLCELFKSGAEPSAVETGANRIFYKKKATKENSADNLRYVPRAKCDLRKDDENNTELIIDHEGVQYRAICPMSSEE